MLAEFVAADDPRWTRVLDRLPHDVYHLPQYSRVAAAHEGGEPIAFYAECHGREMLIPLLLRSLPEELGAPSDWKDASSPYGYPGPLTSHPLDLNWLRECLAGFHALAFQKRVVTAFLRLHPLRGVPAERLAPYGTLVEHGSVVYMDLTRTPEDLCAETRLNHRRDIRRLAHTGFAARLDDWSLYSQFGALYRATMDRVAANDFYYFSDEYFDDLRDALREHLHLCAVVAPDGQVAAAGLFTETDGIIEYHLGGTAPAYLKHAPSKLVFDTVRQWGQSIGATVLNLGGGTGGRADSLFEFKAGFSRSRAAFHTVRIVCDGDRYSTLERVWRERFAGEQGAHDYFPIYRHRPVIVTSGAPARA